VSEKRVPFLSGAADVSPILPGLFPFGVVVVVTMMNAGYPAVQTLAASMFVFTGTG
jgi:predicted branched-subunit amino acid permease